MTNITTRSNPTAPASELKTKDDLKHFHLKKSDLFFNTARVLEAEAQTDTKAGNFIRNTPAKIWEGLSVKQIKMIFHVMNHTQELNVQPDNGKSFSENAGALIKHVRDNRLQKLILKNLFGQTDENNPRTDSKYSDDTMLTTMKLDTPFNDEKALTPITLTDSPRSQGAWLPENQFSVSSYGEIHSSDVARVSQEMKSFLSVSQSDYSSVASELTFAFSGSCPVPSLPSDDRSVSLREMYQVNEERSPEISPVRANNSPIGGGEAFFGNYSSGLSQYPSSEVSSEGVKSANLNIEITPTVLEESSFSNTPLPVPSQLKTIRTTLKNSGPMTPSGMISFDIEVPAAASPSHKLIGKMKKIFHKICGGRRSVA